MLYGNNIPTSQIVSSSGFRRKIRSFDFICTESNRDRYICELVMRQARNQYKIKLTHYAGILDYSAFQAIWIFSKGEEDFATRVYNLLERELERIQEEHDKSMTHPTNLVPIIREAVRPIAVNHRIEKNSVSLKASDSVASEDNWEKAVYGNRYPEYHEESKQERKLDNHPKETIKRTVYEGRNKKTTKEI